MEDQTQQDAGALSPADPSTALSPLQQEAILYAVLALLISCFVVYANKASMVRDAGFVAKILAVLAGSALGTIGALVGNALRKAAHPDAVWTSGGFWSLLWTKVFWRIGPQTIGLLIGIFLGPAIVLH